MSFLVADVFWCLSWWLLVVTLMSFLVADVFWCLSWWLLVVTLMSFLVAAGDYPDVFPGGCW